MVVQCGRRWSALAAMWRCACVLAVLFATLLRCSALKRAEMSPMPFVLTSRYGRSPVMPMMPRSERFYLNSRYGKRSDMGVAGAGGGGTDWRRGCDCERYAGRLQTSSHYKRPARAPELVPTEE